MLNLKTAIRRAGSVQLLTLSLLATPLLASLACSEQDEEEAENHSGGTAGDPPAESGVGGGGVGGAGDGVGGAGDASSETRSVCSAGQYDHDADRSTPCLPCEELHGGSDRSCGSGVLVDWAVTSTPSPFWLNTVVLNGTIYEASQLETGQAQLSERSLATGEVGWKVTTPFEADVWDVSARIAASADFVAADFRNWDKSALLVVDRKTGELAWQEAALHLGFDADGNLLVPISSDLVEVRAAADGTKLGETARPKTPQPPESPGTQGLSTILRKAHDDTAEALYPSATRFEVLRVVSMENGDHFGWSTVIHEGLGVYPTQACWRMQHDGNLLFWEVVSSGSVGLNDAAPPFVLEDGSMLFWAQQVDEGLTWGGDVMRVSVLGD